MRFMLSESYNLTGFGTSTFLEKQGEHDVIVEVGPRVNIVTAWCTNAVIFFENIITLRFLFLNQVILIM